MSKRQNYFYISAMRIGHELMELMHIESWLASIGSKGIVFISPCCPNRALDIVTFRHLTVMNIRLPIFVWRFVCFFFRAINFFLLRIRVFQFPTSYSTRFDDDAFGFFLTNVGVFRNYPSGVSEYFNFSLIKHHFAPPGVSDFPRRQMEVRKLFSLKEDDEIVCLHVRNTSVFNDHFRNWKNASLSYYAKAIKYLAENKRYKIFLFGEYDMSELPLHSSNVVDYVHSKHRSEENDIAIFKMSSYFIGSASGMRTMALIFGKKMLNTNIYPLSFPWSLSGEDPSLFKRYYNLKSGAAVSTDEVLKLPTLGYFYTDEELAGNNLKIVENTSDEIYEFVKDYFEKKSSAFNGGWHTVLSKAIQDNKNVDRSIFYPDTAGVIWIGKP